MTKLLIVVDMLNDFCDKDGVLAKTMDNKLYAEPIIPVIKEKIEETPAETTQGEIKFNDNLDVG